MVDGAFEQSFSDTSRLAAMHAAMIVTTYRLPSDSRRDLEQEAILEVWRKRPAYDPQRGSWRTFSELVIVNRLASLVRRMHSARSGQFREEPLDDVVSLKAPNDGANLRVDVCRVLTGAAPFDRRVALYLFSHSATETSRELGVSRATVYRSLQRLRAAFTEAGLTPGKV